MAAAQRPRRARQKEQPLSWKTERALEKGYRAWKRGELDAAAGLLTAILKENPGLVEAIYPLSRVVHEQGDSPRALELLADLVDAEQPERGALIDRVFIFYDCGDDARLESDLQRLGDTNLTVRGIRALLKGRTGDWENVTLPPTALWNAEIVGRLLALLESSYAEKVPAKEDTFHHQLFSLELPANGDTAPEDDSKPSHPKGPWTRKSWESALRETFARRRFAQCLEVWDAKGADSAWREALSRDYWLYSHYASSLPKTAVERAREQVTTHPRSVDCHFLHGLCLVRVGSSREAAHAFVRCARLEDVQIHTVVQDLAKRLDIALNIALKTELRGA